MKLSSILFSVLLLSAAQLQAADISGTYIAENDKSVTVTLKEAADGKLTGEFKSADTVMTVEGKKEGDQLKGKLKEGYESESFRGKLQGKRLMLEIGEIGEMERIFFNRVEDKDKPASPDKPQPPDASKASVVLVAPPK